MALEIPFGPDQTMVGRQCRRRRGRQFGTLFRIHSQTDCIIGNLNKVSWLIVGILKQLAVLASP